MLDRADEDALAHSSDSAEVGLELELEGPGEHVELHRLLDGVQTTQPVESPLDSIGGLLLDHGPSGPAPIVADQCPSSVDAPS